MKHLTILFILFLCACNTVKTVESEKNSGQINTFKSGEIFIVRLPEIHEKGENWSLQQNFNSTLLEYMGSNFHRRNGGEAEFTFRAITPGKTELSFVLRAYSDSLSSKVFCVEIQE